jgi:hypothetical protein
VVYLPGGYHRSLERWPLIFDVLAVRRMGLDIVRVLAGGIPRRVETGGRLPFFAVAARKTRFRLAAKHCLARFLNPQRWSERL